MVQIYIATDEDEDGKNITALLVNFFYQFWPELFAQPAHPFIYKLSTPFIIARRGNTSKYFYSHDYEDFSPEEFKGWDITRAKGLGSLKEPDWKHSLDNPVLVPIIDDGNLDSTLDLIFNEKRADDRKEWLSNT